MLVVASRDAVAVNATGVILTPGGAAAFIEDATTYVVFGRRDIMRGTVLYGPRDVRFEERPDPKIVEPTDAIIRLPVTCVCGSDLWPYRGADPARSST